MSRESIGRRVCRSIAKFRRRSSRRQVRAALRLAFVGVVLVSGAQGLRPFAGEPSGGLSGGSAAGVVQRGAGVVGVRQQGSTGRGDRSAGRGPERLEVGHG